MWWNSFSSLIERTAERRGRLWGILCATSAGAPQGTPELQVLLKVLLLSQQNLQSPQGASLGLVTPKFQETGGPRSGLGEVFPVSGRGRRPGRERRPQTCDGGEDKSGCGAQA